MTCNSYPLLGGYNIFNKGGSIQKTYTDLPPHSMMAYEVSFFLLDSIVSGDYLTLQFDGRTMSGSSSMGFYTNYAYSTSCGASALDMPFFSMRGRIFHSQSTVNLNITSYLAGSPSTASFGIRRIMLNFMNASTTEFMCIRLADLSHYSITNECPCIRGQYQDPNNQYGCLNCDSSCADCFNGTSSDCITCNTGYSYVNNQCVKCDNSCGTCSGNSSSQCLTCASGYWLQANGTCTSTCSLPSTDYQVVGDFKVCQTSQTGCPTGQYLLYNGSCSTTCPYPLQNSTTSGYLSCNQPCTGSNVLLPNGSCLSTCPSPYTSSIQEGVNICVFQCSVGQYFSYNGSCVSICPSPLVNSSVAGDLYCNKPCNGSDVLLFGGSCNATCSYPFVSSIQQNVSICSQPCPLVQYFSYNGSCISICPSPLVNSSLAGNLYCNKPCNGSNILMPDGSCNATCPAPLVATIQQNVSICSQPCSPGQYLYVDGSCQDSCAYNTVINNTVSTCVSPCTDSTLYIYYNGTCNLNCLSPLKNSIHSGIKECKLPCDNGMYLYPDNSCVSSCPSPFIIRNDNGAQTCISPCSDSSQYYYTTEKTCSATCPTSSTASQTHSIKTCTTVLTSSDETQSVIQSAALANSIGQITDVGIKAASIVASSSPNGFTLVSFTKMLDYIRYMQISYPYKLEKMLELKDAGSLSLNFSPVPELPESTTKKFE